MEEKVIFFVLFEFRSDDANYNVITKNRVSKKEVVPSTSTIEDFNTWVDSKMEQVYENHEVIGGIQIIDLKIIR